MLLGVRSWCFDVDGGIVMIPLCYPDKGQVVMMVVVGWLGHNHGVLMLMGVWPWCRDVGGVMITMS